LWAVLLAAYWAVLLAAYWAVLLAVGSVDLWAVQQAVD
jgi:hypothetical protein